MKVHVHIVTKMKNRIKHIQSQFPAPWFGNNHSQLWSVDMISLWLLKHIQSCFLQLATVHFQHLWKMRTAK